MDKGGKRGNLRVNPYRQAVEKLCKDGIKLSKDVRKCGRANQENQKQKVKRMLNKLFKRMAPLVAGVLLAAANTAVAGYAYISNLVWPVDYPGNQYATVYVTQNPPPSGYVNPAAAEDNYYWWFDGTRDYAQYSDHSTVASVYPGTEAVTVYVYGTGSPYPDLSWATVDRDYGTTIYNGP